MKDSLFSRKGTVHVDNNSDTHVFVSLFAVVMLEGSIDEEVIIWIRL